MEMIPNLDRYWAKANPAYAGASDWNPFAYHSLDTTAVTAPLWDRSSAIRRAFGSAFSASSVNDTARVRAWVLFFVALQDLVSISVAANGARAAPDQSTATRPTVGRSLKV